MNECPLVSVLVRTRNDATYIRSTLDAILSQNADFPYEVIVCDNFSSDSTPEIIAGFAGKVRTVPSPKGAYIPGVTLNMFVRAARGEIVVFNNADAVPVNRNWLSGLVAPILKGLADVTFANQLPRADATWLVRKDSERAFGDGHISCKWPRFFSLASSAARRDDLIANPFSETLWYSEDVEWANRRPMRKLYCPDACVEHSHNYTYAQLSRRFYGEGYSEWKIFRDKIPSSLRVAISIFAETTRDWMYLLRHLSGWRESFGALHRRWVQRFSWLQGMRDAAVGNPPRTISTEAQG